MLRVVRFHRLPDLERCAMTQTTDPDVQIIIDALADVIPVDGEHGFALAQADEALKRIDLRLSTGMSFADSEALRHMKEGP
jgi:hypothetical protein